LILAGIVAKVLGKGAKVVNKNRCKVCRTPIVPGAIYCRQHLREVIHAEDDRLHTTRLR
jgi:predicted nucleic acid-binding Zn ribbon protein